MKYYKKTKLDKFMEVSVWIVLTLNAYIFILNVFNGSWKASISYGCAIVIIYVLWNRYKIFCPKLEEISMKIANLRNQR